MEQGLSEVLARLDVEEISLDEEGRVVISNLQVAERLEAMAAKPKPPRPNGNCVECNTVAGCGPTNTVSNCGCTKRA